MKTPKFFSKLSAVLTPRPKKRLQATARAARPAMDDYDAEEPTTNLSSAFIVVLILHVVAVGGIYAFNSIKASRKERDAGNVPSAEQAAPAPVVAKTALQNDAPPAAQQLTHQPAPPVHTAEPAPAAAASAPSAGRQYQVKAGDTLAKISFAYGVTPAAIMEANHLKENALKLGQTLAIPAAKAPAKVAEEAHKTETPAKPADIAPTATTPGLYTVKKGDTPTSIAHNFGVSLESLLKVNKITDPKKLQLGQTLKLPPRKS